MTMRWVVALFAVPPTVVLYKTLYYYLYLAPAHRQRLGFHDCLDRALGWAAWKVGLEPSLTDPSWDNIAPLLFGYMILAIGIYSLWALCSRRRTAN